MFPAMRRADGPLLNLVVTQGCPFCFLFAELCCAGWRYLPLSIQPRRRKEKVKYAYVLPAQLCTQSDMAPMPSNWEWDQS
jgi:hypothetical protein